MNAWVYVDGEVVPGDRARVPVFDRGFLYGDGVYEVLRTYGGATVWLGEHLQRMAASAAILGFESFPDAAAVESAVRRTVTQARTLCADPDAAADFYIRIIVTRGGGPIALDPGQADEPRLLVIVKDVVLPPQSAYERGIVVAFVDVVRTPHGAVDPAAKTGNYLNNILALRQAKARGADEALMCNTSGCVSEGASSNVFVVRAGELVTPPLAAGILPGITRGKVLDIARELDIPAREADLRPDDVRAADEVFITSSIRELVPVARCDDSLVGLVVPGPVTRRLHAAYREAIAMEQKAVTAPFMGRNLAAPRRST